MERAEDAVLALGIPEVRVRHHGDTARVEVPLAHLDTLLAAREPLTAQLLALGFAEVVLDPGGLQSGRFTLQELGLQHGQERAASDVGAGTGPGSAAR